ncbi:14032_t:CDS:2 [Cetraspora pellucida]|uniref:14032_t:CDS:1 n=1 Tax=Cetraspora pellucida TaxID=1433469 RepID=A0A9N9GYR6_9GLOM|nr:14032_t:CDS:2 [Cetraspora pellucida]
MPLKSKHERKQRPIWDHFEQEKLLSLTHYEAIYMYCHNSIYGIPEQMLRHLNETCEKIGEDIQIPRTAKMAKIAWYLKDKSDKNKDLISANIDILVHDELDDSNIEVDKIINNLEQVSLQMIDDIKNLSLNSQNDFLIPSLFEFFNP